MKPLKSRALPLPDGVCNQAFTVRAPARSPDMLLAAAPKQALRFELRLQPIIRNAVRATWPRLRRLA